MAFQMAQLYFIQSGYLVSSQVHLETKSIELTIHFDLPNYPIIPKGYNYSRREITTQRFYSDYDRKSFYVRCMTLYFNY